MEPQASGVPIPPTGPTDPSLPLRTRLMLTRRIRHLRQRDLAKLLGVSQNTICAWEAGPWIPGMPGPKGWATPLAWVPIVENWIASDQAPQADAIAAAKRQSIFEAHGGSGRPLAYRAIRVRKAAILRGKGEYWQTIQRRLNVPLRTVQRWPVQFPGIWAPAFERGKLRRKLPVPQPKPLAEPPLTLKHTTPEIVRDVLELYLNHLHRRVTAGRLNRRRYDDILRSLMRFATVHGRTALSDCRRHDLTLWLQANPQWVKAWTVRREVGCIVRAFRWAADEDLIAANPYARVKISVKQLARRPDVTSAQCAAVMKLAPRPLRRILFFLSRTGARTCEARELRWSDVDLEQGFVRLAQHKTAGQQAYAKPRVFALEPVVLRILRNMRKRRSFQIDHVFVNSEQTPGTRDQMARAFK